MIARILCPTCGESEEAILADGEPRPGTMAFPCQRCCALRWSSALLLSDPTLPLSHIVEIAAKRERYRPAPAIYPKCPLSCLGEAATLLRGGEDAVMKLVRGMLFARGLFIDDEEEAQRKGAPVGEMGVRWKDGALEFCPRNGSEPWCEWADVVVFVLLDPTIKTFDALREQSHGMVVDVEYAIVERLLEVYDPWGALLEQRDGFAEDVARAAPVDHAPYEVRGHAYHVGRVKKMVGEEGEFDPITVDNIWFYGSFQEVTLEDGHHRLIAAHMRGDRVIPMSYSGRVDVKEWLLGRGPRPTCL